MQLIKHTNTSQDTIPLIAALSYKIIFDNQENAECNPVYDPTTQHTLYAGRDYSTSREDDSAGGIFSSKNDTKKDD